MGMTHLKKSEKRLSKYNQSVKKNIDESADKLINESERDYGQKVSRNIFKVWEQNTEWVQSLGGGGNFHVLTHLTEMSATGVVTKQIGLYLLVQLMAISDTNHSPSILTAALTASHTHTHTHTHTLRFTHLPTAVLMSRRHYTEKWITLH